MMARLLRRLFRRRPGRKELGVQIAEMGGQIDRVLDTLDEAHRVLAKERTMRESAQRLAVQYARESAVAQVHLDLAAKKLEAASARRDALAAERDVALAEQRVAFAERDAAVAERDATVAARDEALPTLRKKLRGGGPPPLPSA
jgi:hypothetical protein